MTPQQKKIAVGVAILLLCVWLLYVGMIVAEWWWFFIRKPKGAEKEKKIKAIKKELADCYKKLENVKLMQKGPHPCAEISARLNEININK